MIFFLIFASQVAICYSSVISDIKDSCSIPKNLRYWFTEEANNACRSNSMHKISKQLFSSKPDHNYLYDSLIPRFD